MKTSGLADKRQANLTSATMAFSVRNQFGNDQLHGEHIEW
jgi:hypothetical protein